MEMPWISDDDDGMAGVVPGGSPGSGDGRRRVGHSGLRWWPGGQGVHWVGLGWAVRLGMGGSVGLHTSASTANFVLFLICICTAVKKNPKLYVHLFGPAETSTSLNCEGYISWLRFLLGSDLPSHVLVQSQQLKRD